MILFHRPSRTTVILIAVAVLAAIFIFINTRRGTNEIMANLVKVEGNSLSVAAKYINTTSGNPYYDDFRDVEVIVDPKTKITRIALQLPSQEELKKTNGLFYPDKLPRVQSAATLDILKKDFSLAAISLTAKGVGNILNSKSFIATEITYTTIAVEAPVLDKD